MKKFLSLFICFSFAFAAYPCRSISFASEQKSFYAKVSSDEVFLYSQPIDSEEYKIFKIPSSYFVLLTSDANSAFYECSYSDVKGFCLKNKVTPMNGTPVTPYANFSNFRVFALDGIEMRSSPYKNPLNVVTKIGYLEDNLIYYGSIYGDELVPKKSNVWYYCKFFGESEIFGYIYSCFCDELESIPLNMEVFDKIEGELFPILPNQKPKPSSQLSGTVKTLIIVGACLPCVVIIYLLIKPTLISEDNEKKKVKVVKKKRKRDYFEFDENDLT